MALLKRRISFYESEEGIAVKRMLEGMVNDDRFCTDTTYSADETHYPDHRLPFVDKHMNYLNVHPNIQLSHYMSNLRLITKKK